jgi:RNA polymerase sigma factor (sigma-70 family)
MASVLRYLNNLLGSRTRLTSTDGQLLRRYIVAGDETAFATLVHRHGQLVWDVCRRLLLQDQDAEDAFQATFLILAEKAASIRKQGSLASWLYGVATRTAWNARKSARRRRNYEQRPEERSCESPVATASLRELQEMLDEELRRLPEKYRAPFVLCCLEGKGRSEAARELGWKEGTVSSRLAKARERLQQRLARRGVTLAAALCAGAVTADVASAAEPMARAIAKNVSERAVILAKGVLRNMAVSKLKVGIGLVLLLGGLTAGGAAAVQRISMEKQPSAPREAAPKAAEQRRADADIHGDPLPPGAVARLGTLRFRADVGALVFSPDGKTIASSGNENVIRLWDVASGKQIRQLPGRWSRTQAIAFSLDGKTLAAGLSLYDVGTGKQIGQMTPPRLDPARGVTSVAFSADGKFLATGHEGPDATARLWNIASRKQIRKLAVCRDSRVTCVAFSPDGKTLATGGYHEEHALRLWDVATGKERYGVRGHFEESRGVRGKPNNDGFSGRVDALAFAPDGKTLATVGVGDDNIRLWDAPTGQELRRFRGHSGSPDLLAFSPDGIQLVSGGSHVSGNPFNNTMCVWDVDSGKEEHQFAVYGATVAALSPDGKTIASGGDNSGGGNVILLWDAATGKPNGSHMAPRGHVDSIAIAPDGKTVATQSWDAIHVWEAATGKDLRRISHGETRGVAFAPDGKLLAFPEKDGSVRLWDASTGREGHRLRGHKDRLWSIAFAPDGKTLATGDGDGTTRLWNVADGKQLRQMVGRTPGQAPKSKPLDTAPDPYPKNRVVCLAFAPDGKTIASACYDYTVRVWEVATGKQVHQLAEPGPARLVAFSPDSRTLASTSFGDNKIRLWEMASGKVRLEIVGHDNFVTALAFSPDGRTLASSEWEWPHETYLWDVRTGKLWGCLGGHRGPIVSLAYSRDGKLLATGSTDTTALLWDMSDLTPERRRQMLSLSPQELESLWQELDRRHATAPARTFVRAVWRLSTVPHQAVPFLARRLRPKILDVKKIPQWIADLESKDQQVVSQASNNLTEIGEPAKLALREALKGKRTAQGREVIEGLLEGVELTLTGDEARALEAIEVLRLIDNAESRALLKKLAGGTPGAQLTRAAAAALKGEPRKPAGGSYR